MTDLEILETVAADTASSVLPSEWGVTTTRRRVDLLSAVRRVIEEVVRPDSPANQVYALTMKAFPGSDLVTTQPGSVHGLRIDGQIWAITAGVGKCYMERYEVDDHGQGHVVEVRDLRSEKSLETDNFGEIKIRSRRRQNRLVRDLRDLEKFLDECPSDTVELVLA